MKSTFVNIKINVPQEFKKKLVSCIAKCFKNDYDLNKEGWYYVDIDKWSINTLKLNAKVPNNWVDIECFINTYGNDFSGSLSLEDEINLLEDYYTFNIYDHYATETETNVKDLEDNWEQDSTTQKQILEWYKQVFSLDWQEIEKQQEKIGKEFIEHNIHNQLDLQMSCLLVVENTSIYSNIAMEERLSFS